MVSALKKQMWTIRPTKTTSFSIQSAVVNLQALIFILVAFTILSAFKDQLSKVKKTVQMCVQDCLCSPSMGRNTFTGLSLILVSLIFIHFNIKCTLDIILDFFFSFFFLACDFFFFQYCVRQLENQFKQDICESQSPRLQPTEARDFSLVCAVWTRAL